MKTRSNLFYVPVIVFLVLFWGAISAGVISRVETWRVSTSIKYLTEAKISNSDSDKMVLLEKAAFLNPNEENFLSTGVMALKLGDNVLAEKYLGRVKTADGYLQLARAYYNLERYDLAAHAYQDSIGKLRTAESLLGLGKSQLKFGAIEDARNSLAASNKIKKTKEVGQLLTLTSLPREAQDPASRAIASYNGLLDLGYPQSAKSVLDMAADNGYLTRDSLITLADREIDAENYTDAYAYLQRAMVIDPYYPQIYQHLVLVCGKLNKGDEAKEYQDFLEAITF